MTDDIYIPFILTQPIILPNVLGPLMNGILKFDTPEGVEITGVKIVDEKITKHLLSRIEELNPDGLDESVFKTIPQYLMRITFETEELVRFRRHPWLEEQLNNTFLREAETAAFFYAYHIDEGRQFIHRNIVRLEFADSDVKVLQDTPGDNISPLQDEAEFLAHLYYKHNDVHTADVFPELVAKYLLMFG